MLDIIFFAIVTFFVFYKLFSVLGSKDNIPDAKTLKKIVDAEVGKIKKDSEKSEENQEDGRIEQEAKLLKIYDKPTVDKILSLVDLDKNFSEEAFVSGANIAFEEALKGFAVGDKEILKQLLSKGLYKELTSQIAQRAKKNEVREITLVSIISSKIKDVEIDNKLAKVRIEFTSEQIDVTKDDKGKVVKGNEIKVEEVVDEWCFSRNMISKDPNWTIEEID